MSQELDRIPLREKKFAQTRLALVEAMMDELEKGTSFEEIKIKDLCKKATISQGTFFNYFPRKDSLMIYFIKMWSIQVLHHTERVMVAGSYFEKISGLYGFTASKMEGNPRIMGEIIAIQARSEIPEDDYTSGEAERLIAFPDIPDPMELGDGGLDSILPEYVMLAQKAGELPSSTDIQTLTVALASLFFGVPALPIFRNNPQQIASFWQKSLELLWKGAGGKLPGKRR